ncbi:hypothetical protein K474DRAFT_577347 [Panus rudis PR-1116 ss-1]|nr:hypothetical protein K474DRAFT_577347 [Panus rudis PR-1116 ss-1]
MRNAAYELKVPEEVLAGFSGGFGLGGGVGLGGGGGREGDFGGWNDGERKRDGYGGRKRDEYGSAGGWGKGERERGGEESEESEDERIVFGEDGRVMFSSCSCHRSPTHTHYEFYPQSPSPSSYPQSSPSQYHKPHHPSPSSPSPFPSHPSHKSAQLHPAPDPLIFNELVNIIETRLQESLDRFVLATYNNVGMPRAWCGSAGGVVIGFGWRYVLFCFFFLCVCEREREVFLRSTLFRMLSCSCHSLALSHFSFLIPHPLISHPSSLIPHPSPLGHSSHLLVTLLISWSLDTSILTPTLPSSVPILTANFTLGGARWWRVLAFPGMWLGLTIFLSAMYGVSDFFLVELS